MHLALYLLALLACLFVHSEARKSAADWKKIDWDAVELDLEHGDDEEFIPTDDELAARRLASGDMTKALEFNAQIQEKNPVEFSSHAQSLQGPTMMIARLIEVDSADKKWDKSKVQDMALEWRSLLALNGIEVEVYDITSEGDMPTLILSTTKGYFGFEIRNFLLRRPEVFNVEWDQKKYYPNDLREDGTALPEHFDDFDFLHSDVDLGNLEGSLPPEVLNSIKGGAIQRGAVGKKKKAKKEKKTKKGGNKGKKKGKKDAKKKVKSSAPKKEEL